MTKFQMGVIGVFGLIIIMSVVVFARYKGSGSSLAEVKVWGTIPTVEFTTIIEQTSLHNNKLLKVTYSEIDADKFDDQFVEELAAGGGPDLFILPHDKIVKQKNKIYLIPYKSYSERQFKDNFIQGSEIFLDPEGIIALPYMVDPLVMYWNRSIFNDAKITLPPRYWDEFYTMSNAISKKDGALNISKSFVSFGEYRNVSNAKEILSTLMMQAGTPIVEKFGNGGRSTISDSYGKPVVPGEAAVNFYTEFSNPVKPFYSWNRSMPLSSTYFLSGDLALYFGFASEIIGIQTKNPNLNFDVAPIPISREGGVNVGYGKFYGLAVSRGTKNPTATFNVASILTSKEGITALTNVINQPPIRRDMLSVKPKEAYKTVFFDSAIRAMPWLDPDPKSTSEIFTRMIESITSGRERTSAALVRASNELNDLLK